MKLRASPELCEFGCLKTGSRLAGTRMFKTVAFFASAVMLLGCQSQAEPKAVPRPEGGAVPMNAAKIAVGSSAFAQGEPIPRVYSGEGEDRSPPLQWSGLPAGVKQLALIVDDPDAPTEEPWVHWVLYAIPPTVVELPENASGQPDLLPAGALQGKNSWSSGRTTGYRGPMPPPGHGTHHYHFKLYALDQAVQADAGLTKAALLKKIEGHIVGFGELVGTYVRAKPR